MKKIHNILFAVAALFASAPFMSAQDIPFPADNTIKFSPDEWNKEYEIKDNVGYRKIISKPNTQGVYYILLDAFTTGREVTTKKAVRSDIVLVLDVSTSMNYDMNGNTTSVDANRRITALKNAVYTFVDLINTNDTENAPAPGERLGNRIAIVPFGSAVSNSGNNQVRDFNTLDNAETIKSNVRGLTIPQQNGTNAHLGMERALQLLQNSTAQIRTVVLFTDGNPGYTGDWDGEDGYATLSYQYGGQQHYVNTLASANNTINYASQIKALSTPKTSPDYNDPTKRVIASVFTVSVITDPKPYTDVYLGKTSSNWDSTTDSMGSYTMSRSWNYYDWDWEYTVSGWNSTDIWANGSGKRAKKLDDQGMETTEDETKYAITAQNASQLEQAFATIASSTGGTSEDLGESSVATVDVVSASFMLPSSADDSSIQVYTAKCEGMNGTQPVFGGLILAPDRKDKYQPMKKNADGTLVIDGEPKDVDDLIPENTHLEYSTPAQEAAGKKDKITVQGFDYSNNWCGEVVENGQHKDWHGYKVTILIPIKMNPDALGGVGVKTNTDGSGIHINGENLFPFTSPKVNLPVNIIINKQGLDVGESSKFTIWRSTNKQNWEEVTSVFVTRHSGQSPTEPRTRIEGLPATDKTGAEYVYKVKEDDWSWSYTLTSDAELLSDDNDNPFTFTNEKKRNVDANIRHAESKVTNTFTTGGKAEYDDSKNNNREVIVVSGSSSNQR